MAEKKHGAEKNVKSFSVRGAVLTGKVISAKAPKTVTVERIITKYVPKYERYKKIRSKLRAHNPESINAGEGDIVRIGETRKLSKAKNFVVMEIVKKGE
nr:30S ribosomal protein S17P [uncultured archaeon]